MTNDLLERVKAATGPDRELDHRIHGAIGIAPGGYGKCANHEDWVATSIRERWNSPAYTASVDAALALVARYLPEWQMEQIAWGKEKGGTIFASIGNFGEADDYRYGHGEGNTVPLAILAALLSAPPRSTGEAP